MLKSCLSVVAEIAQWLGVIAALPEDQTSVSSTQVLLTTAHYSSWGNGI